MKNSIPPARWQLSVVVIVLLCFVCSPMTHAKQPKPTPTPDGDLGNGNTAEGSGALFSLTTGANNTAMGFNALYNNTSGSLNVGSGVNALYNNTTGDYNTATGSNTLDRNTTGFGNTATGSFALYLNTEGNNNTATGVNTLFNNTFGGANTATGDAAMLSNTTGNFNTANGNIALFYNTTGGANTANGAAALYSNTRGDGNTATGDGALLNNTTGSSNTATGFQALWRNASGNSNIALGVSAGSNLSTGSSNIDIGNIGVDGEAYTIRIGDVQTRTFIGGIRGANTGNADAIPVVIDSAGQLGTASSSRRFKDEIKPMAKTSEAILKLKPVTFQYEGDTKGRAQFGLIAEEVAAVNPDLVVRDAQGEIYTVRYEAVNAMLLNEFLKEHRTVQELESVVAKQEAIVAEQRKQIEILTVGLQKVNALVETTKSAPQVANNNR